MLSCWGTIRAWVGSSSVANQATITLVLSRVHSASLCIYPSYPEQKLTSTKAWRSSCRTPPGLSLSLSLSVLAVRLSSYRTPLSLPLSLPPCLLLAVSSFQDKRLITISLRPERPIHNPPDEAIKSYSAIASLVQFLRIYTSWTCIGLKEEERKEQRGRNLPMYVLRTFQTWLLAVSLTINFQITINLPSKMGDLGVYSWEDYFKKKWLLYWATMHLRGGFNGLLCI